MSSFLLPQKKKKDKTESEIKYREKESNRKQISLKKRFCFWHRIEERNFQFKQTNKQKNVIFGFFLFFFFFFFYRYCFSFFLLSIMADLYGTSHSSETEDFSSLINQHLHNTSSLYSSIRDLKFGTGSYMSVRDSISGDLINVTSENMFSSSGALDSDSNVPLKRRGLSSENDLGDFSCDSEGGDVPENLSNVDMPRSSSKRSRSAEVHNLSEKRRRRRINEKMKALQNLIPNSNKTDKASMLDEAIEYLKQLQLQVQMLSMRNGLSLQPMCLPGILQPIQLPQMGFDFDVGNAFLTSRRGIDASPGNDGCPVQSTFDLSNKGNLSDQSMAIPYVPNTTTSETTFRYGPGIQAYDDQFNLSSNFKDSTPKMQSDCPRTGKDSADVS